MSDALKELEEILNVTLPGNLVEEVVKVEEGHFNVFSNATNAFELMKILREDAGIYHLTTISGVEKDDEFNVCYHIQHRIEDEFREVPINFTVTKIDKNKPKTPSMIDFFVAADYYEREIYDFYGVYFENHPFLQRLILPERWPDDVKPMRKEYGWEQIKEITMKIAKEALEEAKE
ncbi:MAG: NADH-quinone oxidoreductase subunit C/D [Candidatus Heimdallarchaeota archaeon AB_125]|nr:MAG: NADH-quinone oxidoreductase subunit C/D [Candidatus Heimdallarchaeota archaeon AB_125]